jgi:hypothetical protein
MTRVTQRGGVCERPCRYSHRDLRIDSSSDPREERKKQSQRFGRGVFDFGGLGHNGWIPQAENARDETGDAQNTESDWRRFADTQYFATLPLEVIVDLLVDGRHGKPALGSTAYQEPRLRVGVQSVWDEEPSR